MDFLSLTQRLLSATLAVGVLAIFSSSGVVAASAAPTTSPAHRAIAAVEQRDGPQFYSGSTITIADDINGDVYAAGQTVTISGNVTGDVIAAAQTINITGTVDGNVRLAAQSVSITGQISKSGTIFAADITVGDGGSFGTDIVGAASTINIVGSVTRNLLVSVDRLTISGPVGGNVTYTSSNDAQITTGAVAGTVERIDTPQATEREPSAGATFLGWLLGLLYALVALSIITLLAGLLLPRWLHRVTDHLFPTPWKALLVGLVAAIAVPGALLLLLVTIIGAPLALAGILVWTVLTLASFVYGAYYLGRLVLRGSQRPLLRSLVGGVILIIALHIPWLNVIVWLAMVFFGLGAQLLEIYRQRPWAGTKELERDPARQVDSVSSPHPPQTTL